MQGLNISEKCKTEWESTLNVSSYKAIDENLSLLIAEFLSSPITQKSTEALKQIVLGFSKNMGVKINRVEFIFDENSNIIGGYNDENKLVVLNLSKNNLMTLDKTEFLKTILHELRHAQQSQIIKYFPNSDLAKTVDFNFKNYTTPTGKIIKNAKYFSNFNEVDAEIFSYIYLEDILSKLKANFKLSDYKSYISQAESMHKHSHIKFKEQLDSSLKIIEINNSAIIGIKKSITEYSKLLFSSNNPLKKEFLYDQANLIISQCEELFNGKGKEFVDFTTSNFFTIQEAMYGNADPIEIVRHLDSPFIKYIEDLENRFGDLGLGKFNQHTRKLKTVLEKGKEFLKAHNISYNENDNGDIIKQVIDNMPAVYLENLAKPEDEEQMQKDHDLSSLIDTYVTRDKDYLHLKCAKYVEKQIPEKKLRELIEKLVDKNIRGTSDFDMRQDLLNGYAQKYSNEKTWHTREEFLNFMGIKCKNSNFSEIYDKFEIALPKFLARSLLKKNLTEQEQQFITNFSLGVYGNIDTQKLKEAIEKQFLSKNRIKHILDNDNENSVLKALESRKINLHKLLNSTPENEKQQ